MVLDIFRGDHVHIYCRQCPKPGCAGACPQKAISKNAETGAWIVDRDVCTRCGACLEACPFHAVTWFDDEYGPVKCDLCSGDPACVDACRFGVIRFLSPDHPEFSLREMPDSEQDPGLGTDPQGCSV